MAVNEVKENKMGVMPVNRLLLNMSLPMVLSMLVQALYNIVDSIFVSKVSEDALTAVSLAFPIQTLMIAFAIGTGVGVNALLSRSLGEKNTERADQVATNGIFLAFVGYILFVLIGIFLTNVFFRTQTDSDVIMKYGTDYMRICCICSIGMFVQAMAEKLLQSTGKTMIAMITQMTGAVTNIILDPILIFGYFGLPRMEVAGAAAATVIGQCVAAVLAVILNQLKNKEVHVSFRQSPVNLRMIGEIYRVGIPSIIMQAIGSVMTYGMNLILMSFSSTAAAVFGVYFKLQSFVFMPVFGLNNGMVPIIAYNYGAGKRSRMIKTIKLSIAYALGVMIAGFVVFQVIPDKLLLLFEASDDMLKIGVPALRAISCCFIFAGFCIVVGSVFQALGKAFYSMIVSIARQLLVLLPAAYILAKIWGLDAVWYAFPIAEISSLALSMIFFVHIYRTIIKHVGSQEA
ncbi:MAG: MATE family efflux transporter [Lachnospiraceae bacterium]|nr:MATE family efflux transporter [Lachnospiraceae bacterium]MBD5482094.1 MATE family efflux transporter [Lachnospiraceae bacterium]